MLIEELLQCCNSVTFWLETITQFCGRVKPLQVNSISHTYNLFTQMHPLFTIQCYQLEMYFMSVPDKTIVQFKVYKIASLNVFH